MNEQTEKLKPCPFCGHEAYMQYSGNAGNWFTPTCRNTLCAAKVVAYGSVDAAVKLWNTRAALDSSLPPDAARAEAYRECAAIVANTPLNGDRVGIVTSIYNKIKAKMEGCA